MFEHLPEVTEESAQVVVEKEIPYFCELVQGCMEKTTNMNEVLDCACKELDERNLWLGKAVRATALGIVMGIKDSAPEAEGIEAIATALTIPGMLGLLRLIDRALEAEKLEKLK